MQKWQQIEEAINNVLEKIFSKSGDMVSKTTPDKLKKKYKSSKTGLRDRLKNSTQSLKRMAVTAKDKTLKKANEAKAKSEALKSKVSSIDFEGMKKKGLLVSFVALFTPAFVKIQTYLSSLKSTTIATFITLTTFGTLAGLNIYTQSKRIAEKNNPPLDAEEVERLKKANALSKRPGYFKKNEKTFKVYDIILPAYFEKNKNISKLVLDFTIESSNKYIKAFFLKNPHYINDVLNSRIEPVSVDFPLEKEGKIIVKEKIRSELNVLLKKLKIKGQINEVHIDKIVGG